MKGRRSPDLLAIGEAAPWGTISGNRFIPSLALLALTFRFGRTGLTRFAQIEVVSPPTDDDLIEREAGGV